MALPDKYYANTTVPLPEVDLEKKRKLAEERQALEHSRRTFQKENAIRNKKIKRQTIIMILFIASGLFLTLFRTGIVYSAQKELVTMQKETREMVKNNEALKANLIKASAIGDLKEQSLVLGLRETDGNTLRVDLSLSHFGEEEMVKEPIPLIEKLFSFVN